MQARMRQMYLFEVVAVALVVVFGGTALAQSSNSNVDTFLGTWKFNADKSTSSGGSNPVKSRTEVVEATPDGGY